MVNEPLQAHLAALPPLRVLYTDFDGTLLGRGGAVLRGPDGRPSVRAAAALVDAAERGVTVVPVSGRRRRQLANDARLLGLDDYIAEAGTVVVRDGHVTYEWGACPRALAGTPHDALDACGAVELLLERFAGDLRHYEPWHAEREGSHLFHGLVDVDEANGRLDAAGLGWAQLIDNGATGGWPGRSVRAYHLLPRGVGKGAAVADDLVSRGLRPAQAAAVGDSLEDATMAQHVATYLVVANGQAPPAPNSFRLDEAMSAGFATAVEVLLRRRPENAGR
jgi:phosphoglycolate phosphatase